MVILSGFGKKPVLNVTIQFHFRNWYLQ